MIKMIKIIKTNYLILFLLSVFSLNTFLSDAKAKDYQVEKNGEVEVVISRSNLNRLKIFHDRIKEIRTNGNELKIDMDKANGELYIKPLVNKNRIETFIKTENGYTYKIIIKIKDTEAQQIFINREDFTLSEYANSDVIRREKLELIDQNLFFDFEDNYKLSAINLIRAMSSMAKLKEFAIINRDYQNLLDYDNFEVNWLYSYIKNDKSKISGEIARITNKTDKQIKLKEEMFFKKGIRAVRIEKLELEPNESCYLYFIGGDAQ